MVLITEKNSLDHTMRYGVAPQMLERIVVGEDHKNNTKEVYNALYLAEPAFGTKAFDNKYTMKGLALFLKANGYAKDIQQVIIQGGIIPHVPPYSSKGYSNDLKFLGQVPRIDKIKSFSEKWLENKIDNKYEQKFYNDYVNDKDKKKIIDLPDAFRAAEIEIKKLMDGLPKSTLLRMQAGEEDRKNIGHIEDTYTQQWSKEKEGQISEMRSETEKRIEKLTLNNFVNESKKVMLEKIISDTSLIKNVQESRGEYYERIENVVLKVTDTMLSKYKMELDKSKYNKLKNKYEHRESEILDKIGKFLSETIKSDNNPKVAIKESIQKMDNMKKENDKRIINYESKLESLDNAAKWTEQLIGGGMRRAVTWFTRQYPVFAPEVEFAFKKAKDQYTKHFFSWDIAQSKTFHVSPRKSIDIETGVINNINSKEKDVATVFYEISEFGNKKILMIHNINTSFSDTTGSNSIKDAKLESNYRNIVLNKFYEHLDDGAQPDIMLLGGHGVGGFRVMPWFKKTEDLIKDEFVKNQKVSYLMTLPTLQSVEMLEWLTGRIVNNHTKRYKKGPYGSAAILHSEDADKVNKFKIIDTAKLIEFGKIASEIDVYDKYINDKTVAKDVKNKLQDIVKENLKKIEFAGDFHLGAPDHPDRYPKDQFIHAIQSYQQKHGLPDIVSWDEMLHGVEDRIFNSASRYLGMIPEKFRQSVIEPILNDKSLNGEEKAYKIAQESLRNQRAITIHNTSDQKHFFKLILKPYADQILADGGQVILTSGNHHNKSQRLSDEALELANQFPESYIDNNKLHVFDGKGNDVGVGTIRLEGGKKLFYMHKFPEVNDEIYGMMTHMRKMNNDADIVGGGDRHQPGAGYADGHLVVLHPGMEPINKFVPLIGKPAGLRGFNNVLYDTNHRGIYTVEFILNPTLEKIVDNEKIL
jgi:hypothetical protein